MKTEKKPWFLELHWQVFMALGLGITAGFLIPSISIEIGFLGDLFLRALKMIIIPLIFFSLVDGVSGVGDSARLGRMGLITMLYYFLSTMMAILVGLVMVNLLHPGVGLTLGQSASLPDGFTATGGGLHDFLLRLLPENILAAGAQGAVLPVITFALLFGVFLSRLNTEGSDSVRRIVKGMLEVIQALTLAIIRLAPIGIFALLAREVAKSGLNWPGIFWLLVWDWPCIFF